MKISIEQMDIDPEKILEAHGLNPGGEAQAFLESEIVRQCEPYMPFDTGLLAGSGKSWPKPGGGYIKWDGPYAHYQYMGVVYGPNIPIKDEEGDITGWWSPPGQKKHPTGKNLQYSTEHNELSGPRWVERMMADKSGEIEEALAKKIGGKPGG